MDESTRALIQTIRGLDSAEAAAWIMREFPITSPDYGRAFGLIEHRSWKKTDQLVLCKYYMQKAPFASARPYHVFAKIMSLPAFLGVIKTALPVDPEDQKLFLYHVDGALRQNSRTAEDAVEVNQFLEKNSY